MLFALGIVLLIVVVALAVCACLLCGRVRYDAGYAEGFAAGQAAAHRQYRPVADLLRESVRAGGELEAATVRLADKVRQMPA